CETVGRAHGAGGRIGELKSEAGLAEHEICDLTAGMGEGRGVSDYAVISGVGDVEIAGGIHQQPGGTAEASLGGSGAIRGIEVAGAARKARLADDDVCGLTGGEGADILETEHAVI